MLDAYPALRQPFEQRCEMTTLRKHASEYKRALGQRVHRMPYVWRGASKRWPRSPRHDPRESACRSVSTPDPNLLNNGLRLERRPESPKHRGRSTHLHRASVPPFPQRSGTCLASWAPHHTSSSIWTSNISTTRIQLPDQCVGIKIQAPLSAGGRSRAWQRSRSRLSCRAWLNSIRYMVTQLPRRIHVR